MTPPHPSTDRSVALVTLGCTRNEVDSEELAGRLQAGGWRLVDDAAQADVAVVNTCGFVEQAKKDSIDVLLEASALKEAGAHPDGRRGRVPGGALRRAARGELPEADAVLGFDSYRDCRTHLQTILGGGHVAMPHADDRRACCRSRPVERQGAAAVSRCRATATRGYAERRHGRRPRRQRRHPRRVPAPASGPRVDQGPARRPALGAPEDRERLRPALRLLRDPHVPRRLRLAPAARHPHRGPVAGASAASRSSSSSARTRRPTARTSATSRLLEKLLPELAAVDGHRAGPGLLPPARRDPARARARPWPTVPGVVPYFDISFQHASGPLLRRMRRFGWRECLPGAARPGARGAPEAGIRSNVIVGFPARPRRTSTSSRRFLTAARLDVVGVFGYSDEDGTEAEGVRRQAARPTSSPSGVDALRGPRRGAERAAGRGAGR